MRRAVILKYLWPRAKKMLPKPSRATSVPQDARRLRPLDRGGRGVQMRKFSIAVQIDLFIISYQTLEGHFMAPPSGPLIDKHWHMHDRLQESYICSRSVWSSCIVGMLELFMIGRCWCYILVTMHIQYMNYGNVLVTGR